MNAELDALQREDPAAGGGARPSPARPRLRGAAAAVVAVAVLLFGVSTWAYVALPPAMRRHPTPQALAPSGYRWLQAWSWWDGAWYVGIAQHGYTFTFGHRRQSAAAFFPGYPLLIRALTPVVGNAVLAGFLLSLVCGIAACLLFYVWSVERAGPGVSRLALAALLVYPCSFYLFGALYADALFLVTALAAFLFLEHDRPALAGLAAAVASATRPIGLALVIGLWARAYERRHGFSGRDRGLLLAPIGFLAYSGFLWARFGDPLFFVKAERGWQQAPGWRSWLKVAWFHRMARHPYFDPPHYHVVGHLLVTVLAFALAVAVFRRLGWGYGVYSVALVVGSALSTKDFTGMGRYALSAFPCFTVGASLLAERPRAQWAVLASSAVLLLLLTELHARNMLIS